MVGLTHPTDIRAWQRWQDSTHPLRSSLARLRSGTAHGRLYLGGPAPDVLVALDSGSPSNRASLLAPLAHLPRERLAVLAPDNAVLAETSGWSAVEWSAGTIERRLDPVRVVLAAGHYLPLGAAGYRLAVASGLPFLVVQHGLLTPHAPPLPANATLLAWTEADASYWRSGRDDVAVHVVGSQLLWHASSASATDGATGPDRDAVPTYLGQLHGAEIARPVLSAAAGAFCHATGATYRPHPSERDRASRRQHARWEQEGITIDRRPRPLAELLTPVVSVFSTGVLEAAARGVPAYVDLPQPPSWLEEFWERYRMGRWGGSPTQSPERPVRAPALAVAAVVRDLA